MNIEDQLAVLEGLAKNEEAVALLYETYSRQFQNTKEFWEQLALEEIAHAAAIRSLHPLIKSGAIGFDQDRFNMQAIGFFHNYVGELINKAQGKDLVWALSVAMDLEESLIERKFFTVFKTDSQQLKYILNKLAEDTQRHFNNIREAWERYRSI
ncbi:MAG: hypothetical protein FJZ08_03945 [Candidatus Omnitrophica bacterium]|nr:hypothetical protein [Candidatus Omnitrophota bacterium]